MKLTDLQPRFLHIESEKSHRLIDNMDEADGIEFLCPKCFQENGYSDKGVHIVICWQPHVPQSFTPRPGRWNFLGTGYNDLTLQAGSSSILLNGGCYAHFFVENGQIRMA
jgi:hypothetical protein